VPRKLRDLEPPVFLDRRKPPSRLMGREHAATGATFVNQRQENFEKTAITSQIASLPCSEITERDRVHASN